MNLPDTCISPEKVQKIMKQIKKDVKKHYPTMTNSEYDELLFTISKYPAAASMIAPTLTIIKWLKEH